MPSIADQVATVEHDLAAALASIDTLTAQNAALTSANTSLQSENAALQAQCSDMKHQVDDVRGMADSLARSALDMLRASRQHIGASPPTNAKQGLIDTSGFRVSGGKVVLLTDADKKLWDERYAQEAPLRAKLNGDKLADLAAVDGRFAPPPSLSGQAPLASVIDTVADFLGTTLQNNTPEPPAQAAVAEIMQGDSGDEQPARTVSKSPLFAAPYGEPPTQGERMTDAEIAAFNAQTDSRAFVADTSIAPPTAPLGFTHCADCPDPVRCIGTCLEPIVTSADAMKARLGQPIFVDHSSEGLPIFLKPSFAPERAIFG